MKSSEPYKRIKEFKEQTCEDLKSLFNNGSIRAAYELGCIHRYGTEVDLRQAASCFGSGTKLEDLDSMFELARMMMENLVQEIEPHSPDGLLLMSTAAHMGSEEACWAVGFSCFYAKYGVENRNFPLAAYWLGKMRYSYDGYAKPFMKERAVELESEAKRFITTLGANAAYELGMIYRYEGENSIDDYNKARDCFERGVRALDPESMVQLAYMMIEGLVEGLNPHSPDGLGLLLMITAASLGSARACWAVAFSYFYAKYGVRERNFYLASYWFNEMRFCSDEHALPPIIKERANELESEAVRHTTTRGVYL